MAAPSITNAEGWVGNYKVFYDPSSSSADNPTSTQTSHNTANASIESSSAGSYTPTLTLLARLNGQSVVTGQKYLIGVPTNAGAIQNYSSGSRYTLVLHRSWGHGDLIQGDWIETTQNKGYLVALLSGSSGSRQWKIFSWGGRNFVNTVRNNSDIFYDYHPIFIDPNAAANVESNSLDVTDINRIELGFTTARTGTAADNYLRYDFFVTIPILQIVNGEVANPASVSTIPNTFLQSTASPLVGFTENVSSTGVANFIFVPFSIGNGGSIPVYFKNNSSPIFMGLANTSTCNQFFYGDNLLTVDVNLGSSDYCDLSQTLITSPYSCDFRVIALHASATTNFDGLTLRMAGTTTLHANYMQSGGSFVGRESTTLNGASLARVSFLESTGAAAVIADTSATLEVCQIANSANAGILISSSGDYSGLSAELKNNGTYDVYIAATVASGQTVDISGLVFAAGSTTPTGIYWAGTTGSITVVVGQSGLSTATAGGTITLVEPQSALTALNFDDDIRIYTARYQTFVINSADINTSTDQITLGTDNETGAAFAGQITAPATLAYLVAAPGATLPTGSPQIATNRLYYVVANSAGVIQISETEGGAAINFSTAGTESGGYLFSLTCATELSNELISGGSGFSAAYTLPDGALIEVAAQGIAADESTATTLFHRIVEWSSSTGASIADTFSLANNPDTIYGQLIGATITSKRGVAITVTTTPSTVSGIAFDLSGNIELDANAITASTLYAPDAYVWSIYQRYTEDGIRFIRNQLEALSIMEFDFNGVLTIDNVADGIRNSPATPLIILGNLYTSAESIYAENSGTIRVEPFFVSDLTSAGDGSFTSSDRTQLDDLYATLESAGVFSEAALANAPSGGTGGGDATLANQTFIINHLTGIKGATWDGSTDSLEAIRDRGDAAWITATSVTVSDKTGFSLSSAGVQAIWEYSTRTLSSFGTLVADTAAAVWSAVTRSLTDKAGFSLTTDERTAIATATESALLDNFTAVSTVLEQIPTNPLLDDDPRLDVLESIPTFPTNFSSLLINASGHVGRVTLVDTTTTNTDMRGTDNALLAADYTAPDNVSILAILEDTGTTIPTTLSTLLANLATVDTVVDGVKAKTDQLTFTQPNQVDANALTGGGGDDAETIYNYFTASDRADAFKATGFSTLTTADIPTAASIAGAVQTQLDDDFAALADILADIPDDVAAQSAIAAMLNRILKISKARGLEPGITATVVKPAVGVNGSLTVSDDSFSQTLVQVDSKTVRAELD